MLKIFFKYHFLNLQHRFIKIFAKPNFEKEVINDKLGYGIYLLFKYKGTFNAIFSHKIPIKNIDWYYYYKQKNPKFNL